MVGDRHDQIIHVLEEFMLEAGATKGRELRLEVRRIRSGASQDRHGDVVWFDLMAQHRHLVDVTVTSACTNTNVPRTYARLPLMGSLALGAQHMANLIRTSALLLYLARLRFSRSMTTIPSLSRTGAGWRLWRLSWLIALLFWWQFVAPLAWVLPTLVLCALGVMSVCNISFVELFRFLFGDFWGMCGESSFM
jgi:hypothetical protein